MHRLEEMGVSHLGWEQEGVRLEQGSHGMGGLFCCLGCPLVMLTTVILPVSERPCSFCTPVFIINIVFFLSMTQLHKAEAN